MSDVDPGSPPPSGRVLTGLFWTGVGLVPLAGLVLLLGGDGGAMRVAAFLTMLAVVLIGLSITLRPDASTVRVEMEELLLEEIDMLREDVRDDITTAVRATHQASEERMQILQQTVDALRAELDVLRVAAHVPNHPVAMAHAGAPPPPAPPPAAATAAVQHQAAASVPVPPPGQPPHARGGGETYASAASAPGAAGRAHVPTGVVRHTETVHHVTTRSMFVDRPGEDDGYHEQASSPPAWAVPAQQAAALPEEESWTDRMLRERYGASSDRSEAAERRGGRRRRWEEEADDEGRHAAGPRGAGGDPERWGSLHRDDRAEELRMGERRAAMRSHEGGTEMRIEDRWAAMRREWDPDRDRPERDRPERDRPERDRPERVHDMPAADWREVPTGRREMRALPSADDLPSWNAEWEEPVRQSRGRRDRPGGGHPSGQRFDFELSDERWR